VTDTRSQGFTQTRPTPLARRQTADCRGSETAAGSLGRPAALEAVVLAFGPRSVCPAVPRHRDDLPNRSCGTRRSAGASTSRSPFAISGGIRYAVRPSERHVPLEPAHLVLPQRPKPRSIAPGRTPLTSLFMSPPFPAWFDGGQSPRFCFPGIMLAQPRFWFTIGAYLAWIAVTCLVRGRVAAGESAGSGRTRDVDVRPSPGSGPLPAARPAPEDVPRAR
jgi:hypothetical protein